MTNVLLQYLEMQPTVQMTFKGLQEASKTYGFALKSECVNRMSSDLLEWCDVLISVRSIDMLSANICKIAHKKGKFVIYELDDDFLAIKDFHIRRRIQEKAIHTVLKNTQLLLASTKPLAQKYCNIGNIKRGAIIETPISVDEIRPPFFNDQLFDDRIKIAYYVNDGSTDCFDIIIRPILKELNVKYSNKLEWHFFSIHPKFSQEEKINAVFYERMSLNEFRDALWKNKYWVGISPLFETEFTDSKYINKFLEYSRAGIPAIYSNVIPYKGFIENEFNGIIVNNSKEDWIRAFDDIMNPELRDNIIQNAQEQVLDEFSSSKVLYKLVEQIPELYKYKAPKNRIRFWGLIRIKSYFYSVIEPFSKAWGRLRIEGIVSLFRYSFSKMIKRN